MPRELRLICHPFHNGLEGVDMGAGPLRLIGDPAIPGWELLRQTIPGFAPAPEPYVVLVGVRDLEEHQRAPLEASAMRVLPGASFESTELLRALDELGRRTARTYLHIDLDVLDTSEDRANRFAAAGGLSAPQLEWAAEMVFRRCTVAAAAITAYDPGLDEDGRVARAASRVIATVARCALQSGPPPPGGPDASSSGRLR